MRSTRKSKLSLALTGILPGVLMACLAAPVTAATESQPARGVVGQYDAAHEMTINGTVQQVITKHTVGAAPGMHLTVNGTAGTVDVHVGPYLSKSMQQALRAGSPIQIVGAMVTIRCKQLFLARYVMITGQTITVRSNTGFLLRPAQSSLSPRSGRAAKLASNGGAL